MVSEGVERGLSGDRGAGEGGGDVDVAGAVGEGVRRSVGIRPLVGGDHQAGLDGVRRERGIGLEQQRRGSRDYRRGHGGAGEREVLLGILVTAGAGVGGDGHGVEDQ